MSEIAQVLDDKFSQAFGFTMDKSGAVVLEQSFMFGQRYELMGLDCEQGSHYRYLVSRGSLDTKSPKIEAGIVGNPTDIHHATHILIRIPRALGDSRTFEQLPREAIEGPLVIIDGIENSGIEIIEPLQPARVLGARALDQLAQEIASLRVVERLPFAS